MEKDILILNQRGIRELKQRVREFIEKEKNTITGRNGIVFANVDTIDIRAGNGDNEIVLPHLEGLHSKRYNDDFKMSAKIGMSRRGIIVNLGITDYGEEGGDDYAHVTIPFDRVWYVAINNKVIFSRQSC